MFDYITKFAQYECGTESEENIIWMGQATSTQQSAGWMMQSCRRSFRPVKEWFIYEERGERRVVLWTTVLLFNLETKPAGLNQILWSYMLRLNVEANLFL